MSSARVLPLRLRHRLILESPQRVADGLGGFTLRWQFLAVVWATVNAPNTITAFENDDSGQPQPRAQLRIRIRRREGIFAGQRLSWGGRAFLIRAVRDDSDSAYLELITEEVAA